MLTKFRAWVLASLPLLTAAALLSGGFEGRAQTVSAPSDAHYEFAETRQLVSLVTDASDLVRTKGEAAFEEFRLPGSRWRQGDTYIAVLDLEGNMRVHPDPALEGHNVINLKDINGKPIIRGIIHSATVIPNRPEGWYHYQWPVPGGLLPRWKSTYARLVTAPSGKRYVVLAGMYNDSMERSFVVDLVNNAVAEIEKKGRASFLLFHDATGPYIAKDAYIFVIDRNGVEFVNPAFPNLEGRNILNVKDTQGRPLVQQMLKVVDSKGSGWVEYMWPKPGESVSTQKSAYVSKARLGGEWVVVGCGVYLAGAPKAPQTATKMTASELMNLVREAAAVFEKQGEKAYPEFRTKGSKWFRDDTYFFVWSMDGVRLFNAAFPQSEGKNVRDIKDVKGRPFGRMILASANNPSGEGWLHYVYPEPGDIFPTWKSTFVKRVTFPNGKTYAIGCGIYQMQMDKPFIEDVVNRAADLVAAQGGEAFPKLRDKAGPFVFMDTYIFVDAPNGTELVNAAQPSLEGKDLIDVKDAKGNAAVRDYIDEAMRNGSAWVEYYWYKPGQNAIAKKASFVRKVQHGNDVYIVGSGYYLEQ